MVQWERIQQSFEKAANDLADSPADCPAQITNTFIVTVFQALAVHVFTTLAQALAVYFFAAVEQTLAAAAAFEAVDEQAQGHVLAALEHALAQLLLEAAGAAGVVGAAVHAVRSVTVAAQVAALDGPAAGVHAVVVAAARGVVHRNAAAAHSLVPLPTIILFYGLFWVLVDDDHRLRRSGDDHLLIIADDNRILTWGFLLRLSYLVRRLAVVLRPQWLCSDIHGNSVEINLFVAFGCSCLILATIILCVVRLETVEIALLVLSCRV